MTRIACVAGVFALLAAPALAAVITRTASTASFELTLSVGPLEPMYTQAQVKASHPKEGEVMLGGGMAGMAMGKSNRHLEVHVTSRATGKAVTNVMPSITLADTTAMSGMAMSDKVDVVAMEGIGEGAADLHYGNNVKLAAGHTYKVVVTVKREKASFTFRA